MKYLHISHARKAAALLKNKKTDRRMQKYVAQVNILLELNYIAP